MRRFTILAILFLFYSSTYAQLLVIFQAPPSGILYKPQMWTMVITNTGNSPINLHIEATLTPTNSASQILSGVTRTILIQPGTTQINASTLVPIQYNIATGAYNVDPNPNGLLPIGSFEACYHFFKHAADNITEIAEQCQEIVVAPLSPAQLVYPYNQTAIEELNPQFSWLPPLPSQMFTTLQYDLRLVEITANQTAADAIEQDIPIYQGTNLLSNSILYPLSATALQYGKHYAWRVIVKNNGSPVGETETWEFSLKQFGNIINNEVTGQPFVELRKGLELGYTVFVNELKFSYRNETSDSVWNLRLFDLTRVAREGVALPIDSLGLHRGQNLIKIDGQNIDYLVNHHSYLLELSASNNEKWRLRFEFRRQEENNH